MNAYKKKAAGGQDVGEEKGDLGIYACPTLGLHLSSAPDFLLSNFSYRSCII